MSGNYFFRGYFQCFLDRLQGTGFEKWANDLETELSGADSPSELLRIFREYGTVLKESEGKKHQFSKLYVEVLSGAGKRINQLSEVVLKKPQAMDSEPTKEEAQVEDQPPAPVPQKDEKIVVRKRPPLQDVDPEDEAQSPPKKKVRVEDLAPAPHKDEDCEPKQDPFQILSSDVVSEIFSYLNLATLGASCCVSRRWRQLVNANDLILWKNAIYREIAFGTDKWVKCFGTDVVKEEDKREDFSSLPIKEFIEACRKSKLIFPDKSARSSLMLVRLPKTLSGQLTLKSLGELARKFFPESYTGSRYGWSSIVAALGDTPIDKSCWVLMTKDVLPGSRSKSCAQQQAIVTALAANTLIPFKVPTVLEAAVCILSQYVERKTRLFGDNPWSYTRCKDEIQGDHTIVGFAPDGLRVGRNCYVSGIVGVAALLKC
jgi:hypothetical protein